MKYLTPATFALVNLSLSLIPGNPAGWLSAVMFFGCVLVLSAMAGYDVMELLFGGDERDEDEPTPPGRSASGRDPFDVFLVWSMIGSAFALAVVVSVAWPLLYVWLIGLAACFAVGVLTVVAAGSIAGDGPLGFLFGMELVKGGFQVIGYILVGLLQSTRS